MKLLLTSLCLSSYFLSPEGVGGGGSSPANDITLGESPGAGRTSNQMPDKAVGTDTEVVSPGDIRADPTYDEHKKSPYSVTEADGMGDGVSQDALGAPSQIPRETVTDRLEAHDEANQKAHDLVDGN